AVIPLVLAVAIGLFGDVRGQAALRQLLFELLANPRLLVHVSDLLVAEITFPVVPVQDPRRAERDVAGGILPDVEVLVVPLLGRGEDGPLMPRNDRLLAARRPHDAVPLAGRNDDDAS